MPSNYKTLIRNSFSYTIILFILVICFSVNQTLASSAEDTGSSAVMRCLDLLTEESDKLGEKVNNKDYLSAIDGLKAASDRGNRFAGAELCLIAVRRGIPKEIREHKDIFNACRKGAYYGSAPEQSVMGRIYYGGIGVDENINKAMYWFKEAAEQGIADSQFILGLSYLQGKGVPRDYLLAYKWLNLASSAGYEGAPEIFDTLSKALSDGANLEGQRITRLWKPKSNTAVWPLEEQQKACEALSP